MNEYSRESAWSYHTAVQEQFHGQTVLTLRLPSQTMGARVDYDTYFVKYAAVLVKYEVLCQYMIV